MQVVLCIVIAMKNPQKIGQNVRKCGFPYITSSREKQSEISKKVLDLEFIYE